MLNTRVNTPAVDTEPYGSFKSFPAFLFGMCSHGETEFRNELAFHNFSCGTSSASFPLRCGRCNYAWRGLRNHSDLSSPLYSISSACVREMPNFGETCLDRK